MNWMTRCPPQLKQVKVAKNSIQISADVCDGGKIGFVVEKLKEYVVHQVFGAFALPMRDVERTLRQPGVMLEEGLLLGPFLAVARCPVRDGWFEVKERHLQEGCLKRLLSFMPIVNIR